MAGILTTAYCFPCNVAFPMKMPLSQSASLENLGGSTSLVKETRVLRAIRYFLVFISKELIYKANYRMSQLLITSISLKNIFKNYQIYLKTVMVISEN